LWDITSLYCQKCASRRIRGIPQIPRSRFLPKITLPRLLQKFLVF